MNDLRSAPGKRHAMAHDRGFALRPAELLALIYFGAAAVGLLAVGAVPTPLRLDPPLLAHVTGLLAGYGVAIMLVLMSRTPALERGVGADRLARWHGLSGRAIFALIGAHAIAATQSWVHASGRSGTVAVLDLLRLPGLLTATVGTVLILGIGMGSARAVRGRLSYEQWHALHLATYLAVGLAFSHQYSRPGPGRPPRHAGRVGLALHLRVRSRAAVSAPGTATAGLPASPAGATGYSRG